MTNWEEIRKEWESSTITFKALAEKHGVKDSTIRSRKNREKWQRNDNATQRNKKVATEKEQRYRPGSRKGAGNPNPKRKFAQRNSAARKHGLFSRYMPKETLEIIESMGDLTAADIIWSQIQIQYAAIIRAQQIMYVEDQDDTTAVLKKRKESDSSWEKEYEIQFAWDKHATFLNAQSKALAELRSSIKQFDEMASLDDERRLKLEQMQLTIDKTKAEIDKLSNGENDGPIEIMIKRKE